jgi:hypothetical protein
MTEAATPQRTRTCVYRCKRCNTTRRVGYLVSKHSIGYGRFEYTHRRADTGAVGPGGEVCCGRPMAFGWLQATLRPEVKCNARCTHAVGFICDCSCGGKNHATGGGMFTNLLAEAA